MNFKNNKVNSLLVGIFIAYWLFVLFTQIFSHPRIDYLKSSLPGQIFIPPTYKMYTNPPKNIVKTYYTFYQNGDKLITIDADSLFHQRIKEHMPFPMAKRDVKQYALLYFSPNLDIGNNLYEYLEDSIVQKEKSFQIYLEGIKPFDNYISNQLKFARVLQVDLGLEKSDSVLLEVIRNYNFLKMDPGTTKKYGYYIQDTVLIMRGVKL